MDAPPTNFAGKRILVVEDMALVAHEMEFILKRLQCDIVGPMATIEDALQAIAQQPLHGAILDINLNGVDSFPVADALNQRGIPFVFTTGYGISSMPPEYQDHPRLEKPFGLKDMSDAMTQMFQHQSQRS